MRGSHTHNILGSHLRAAAIGGHSWACGATETVAQTGWPVRLDGMLDKGQRWRFGEGARCKSPERLGAAGISRCPSYRLPPTTQRYRVYARQDRVEARMGKVVTVVHCWRLVTLRGDTTEGGVMSTRTVHTRRTYGYIHMHIYKYIHTHTYI